MSKTQSKLVDVQSAVRIHACQDSVADILSRHFLNVTDAGTLQVAEETETYKRALQALKPSYNIVQVCLKTSKLSFWRTVASLALMASYFLKTGQLTQ